MSQNLFSNINGSIIPTLETEIFSGNEAVRSQYGLYETMLLQQGQIDQAELHWQRLWKGLDQLGFNIPQEYNASFFEKQILDLASRNEALELGRIRIQIFAEGPIEPLSPAYFIEAIPIEISMTQWNENGLVLGILEDFRKPMTPESNYKINHSLHIPLAKKAVVVNNWDDALLLNTAGRIIESSIANLFWVKAGKIFTPPLDEGCLAGTMRAFVIKSIKANQFAFEEKPLLPEDLASADEVFLTNSIRKFRWVKKIGTLHFGNQKMLELFQKIF